MLFFKKKKEETAEIPKYKFLVNLKDDEIEYAIIHFNVTNKDNSKELRLIYSFCIMFGNIEYAVIPRTDNISLFDTLNIIFFIMNAISTFKIK